MFLRFINFFILYHNLSKTKGEQFKPSSKFPLFAKYPVPGNYYIINPAAR